jgi:hypothetical protein
MLIRLPLTLIRNYGLLGFAGLACATTTAIGTKQSVLIATREHTVVFQRAPSEASFDITVVAANMGPDSIDLSRCRSAAQRVINKTWAVVFRPECAGRDSIFSLAPGDSAIFPMRISGYTESNPPSYPTRFASLTPGDYRLVFGIVVRSPLMQGQLPPLLTVISSPFIVRE